jgi:hypothetical protein
MPDKNGAKLTGQEALKNEDMGRQPCDTSLVSD